MSKLVIISTFDIFCFASLGVGSFFELLVLVHVGFELQRVLHFNRVFEVHFPLSVQYWSVTFARDDNRSGSQITVSFPSHIGPVVKPSFEVDHVISIVLEFGFIRLYVLETFLECEHVSFVI